MPTPLSGSMLRGRFDDAEPDTHGRITNRTVLLDGVATTRVDYAPGSRWSVGEGGCAFVEPAHGTAEHYC